MRDLARPRPPGPGPGRVLDPPDEVGELVFIDPDADRAGRMLFREFVAEPAALGPGFTILQAGVPVGTACSAVEARRRIETLAGLRTCTTHGHAGPLRGGSIAALFERRGTCGTCGLEMSEADHALSRLTDRDLDSAAYAGGDRPLTPRGEKRGQVPACHPSRHPGAEMPATETATAAAGTTARRRRPPARTRAAGPAASPAAAPPLTAAAAPAAGAAHGTRQPDAAAPAPEGSPRERWLAAARRRFEGNAEKEPITGDQLTYLLDLLHEEGQDRRLVSETYGYLDRGMSKAHASMQIRKLRGEFVERRPAAA